MERGTIIEYSHYPLSGYYSRVERAKERYRQFSIDRAEQKTIDAARRELVAADLALERIRQVRGKVLSDVRMHETGADVVDVKWNDGRVQTIAVHMIRKAD